MMSRVLLDTSVVIAAVNRELPAQILPAQDGAISALTLCELHHGVLFASDEQRFKRLLALDIAQRTFDSLPVDQRVAPWFGRLMAEGRRATGARPDSGDALIAATALAHDLPILTRDRDFEAFQGVEVLRV
jgi:predicted nucleic acid-binding protein